MMNRAATAHFKNREPLSRHAKFRRLTTNIAHERLHVSQLALAISLLVLATSAFADTMFHGVDTMFYEFVPDESEFALMGGIASYDQTYTIEGSLGLDVDFDANVASFVDVDATLFLLQNTGPNVSGFLHGESLDSVFNLTGATGTVIDATTFSFTSVDDQGFTVSLDVSLMPMSLTLVGENVPECCDLFSYEIDAVADLVPDESVVCDFNGDNVCNTADIDLMFASGDLVAGLPVPPADAVFDLNADGVLNTLDSDQWLSRAATENGFDSPYLKGDSNLDGIVDATDLNALALSWQGSEKVWSDGDFTGEGISNAADLNLHGSNWRQTIHLDAVAKSVPEPSSIILLGVAAIFGLSIRRKY